MKTKETAPKSREQLFAEKAAKNYAVCHSQTCSLRTHCLRWLLRTYTPQSRRITTCVNLNHPAMQTDTCPMYRNDQPVRMPLGLKRMYYDMPHHLERTIKTHLIGIFSLKRYYQYHGGRRPVTPDVEQVIRQTLLAAGWTQEPVFDDYTEEYLC
jgi:hypothetical protein